VKIFLAPSTIKAVCDLAIKAIEDERVARNNAMLAPYVTGYTGFWFWKKPFTRSILMQIRAMRADERRSAAFIGWGPPEVFPSNWASEQWARCVNLRAIARHKMTAGLIEVPDPYLSDIAQFLGPDEDTRI
jgi:hypothetical protein